MKNENGNPNSENKKGGNGPGYFRSTSTGQAGGFSQSPFLIQ